MSTPIVPRDGEVWCWLIWGRTKSNFCELVGVCTSPEVADEKVSYLRRDMAHGYSHHVQILNPEPRLMDHLIADSMKGIGQLPRDHGDWNKP